MAELRDRIAPISLCSSHLVPARSGHDDPASRQTMPAKPSKYHGYFNVFATELQNVFANDSQKHFRGTEPEEIPPEVSAKQNETGPDQAAHELVSKDKRALMVALLGTAELGRSPLHPAAQEVGIAVFEALGGIGGG